MRLMMMMALFQAFSGPLPFSALFCYFTTTRSATVGSDGFLQYLRANCAFAPAPVACELQYSKFYFFRVREIQRIPYPISLRRSFSIIIYPFAGHWGIP